MAGWLRRDARDLSTVRLGDLTETVIADWYDERAAERGRVAASTALARLRAIVLHAERQGVHVGVRNDPLSADSTIGDACNDLTRVLKATKQHADGSGRHTGMGAWGRHYARELKLVRLCELTEAMIAAWEAKLLADCGPNKQKAARKRLLAILRHVQGQGVAVGPAPIVPPPLSTESTVADAHADLLSTLEPRGPKFTKYPRTWARHYMGDLASVRVVDLTEAMVDKWHAALVLAVAPARAKRALVSGLRPVLVHAHMHGLPVFARATEPEVGPAAPPLSAASTVADVCADLVRVLRERARAHEETGDEKTIGLHNFQAPLTWARRYMGRLGAVRMSDLTVDLLREWHEELRSELTEAAALRQARKLGAVVAHARKQGLVMPELRKVTDSAGRLYFLPGSPPVTEPPPASPDLLPPLAPESTVAEVCANLVATLRARADYTHEIKKDAYRGPLNWSRKHMGPLRDVRVRDLTDETIASWHARLATLHTPPTADAARKWLNRVVEHARMRDVLPPPPPPPAGTVLAVAEDWRRQLQARHDDPEEGLSQSYLSVPTTVKNRLGSLAMLQVSELNVENVGAWYRDLLKVCRPGQAFTLVLKLRGLINHARQMGISVANPTREIKRPESLELPPALQTRPSKRKKSRDFSGPLAPMTRESTIGHAAMVWMRKEVLAKARSGALRKSTVEQYCYFLDKLEERAQQDDHDGEPAPPMAAIKLSEVRRYQVDDWLKGIEASAPWSAKLCLAKIRTLFKYVMINDIELPQNLTMKIKIQPERKLPRPLADAEMGALREAVAVLYQEQLQDGLRRKLEGVYLAHHIAPLAVLWILLLCGARAHEIYDTHSRDVKGDRLYIPRSKTHRPRSIGIDASAAEVAAFQIDLVCGGGNWAKDGASLFLWGRTRKSLHNAIYRAMRKAVILAGLAKPWPHPHDLRHTFVWLAIQMDTALHHIASALGHASVQTTKNTYGDGAQYLEALKISHALSDLTRSESQGPASRGSASQSLASQAC